MPELSTEQIRIADELSDRYKFSNDAVRSLLAALVSSGGRMAQFNHPELGGMGQWSQGGMIMIGDMFNTGLKDRVNKLCNELSNLLRAQESKSKEIPALSSINKGATSQTMEPMKPMNPMSSFESAATNWWPSDLGVPSSVGMQNDFGYACFPAARKLAIYANKHITIYDTGTHRINGFSQRQSDSQTLTFTSDIGPVTLDELTEIGKHRAD